MKRRKATPVVASRLPAADAEHYDLVIDTSETSLDDAVDRIVAVSESERGETS